LGLMSVYHSKGPCKYPKDGERRLSPSFRTKDVFRRPKDDFCWRKTCWLTSYNNCVLQR